MPAKAATAETAASGRPQTGLKIVPLTLVTADGRRHGYKVELAQTQAQQAIGMMHRTRVPAGTGMLFPFDPPRPASFWMRNTPVSLDLVFIGADRRVRNIVAGAVPHSLAMMHSVGPVVAVLELAGGEAERIGLAPGDAANW